jgi:hypothetical protein
MVSNSGLLRRKALMVFPGREGKAQYSAKPEM